MSLTFAELLARNKEGIVQELARLVKEKAGPTYATVPLEQLLPRMAVVFDAMHQAISQQVPQAWEEFVETTVRRRVGERYALEEIQALISMLRDIVLRYLQAAYAEEPGQQIACILQMEDLAHRARQRAFEVYLRHYEEKTERQQRVLAELSTPVIQVHENILVVPLVGAIDTERARRVMEELLLGITAYQAELVIIDITGVPVVDTAVANHLMQTIKAARLLGAQSILVGISGEVAQTLVHLQIDLSGVVTRSNLQAGIEYALERMGLEISPKGEELSAEAMEEASESGDSRSQRGQEVSGWPAN